ncbi:serine hydrolase domain-containing protein [Psychrobacter celer]|uniref:serine hydrolase domain-containing protein n=1 Tax=Psychrobacter celer TaxID=306572 RepID=UPI003FD04A3B
MFQKLTTKDLGVFFLLVVVTVIIAYFYANSLARNKLWQKTYPIRAELSALQITCSDDSPTWLADILRYQTRHGNAPANQITYIEPNGTLHHCENGYQGKYTILSDATTEQTRFRYASVTKLWTSDAILALVKEGRLSLDTKLSAIITEIDTPKDARIKDITIGQLLTHRAGFDRYSVFGQDMFGIGKAICPNHITKLNNIELGFTPDTKTSYSNLGYCLLGEVVSRIYNKPYTKVIAENYSFADTSLRFIPNHAMNDEVTYNYVETGLTGYADIYTAFDYEGLASAAGLSGNAIDLAQQVQAMSLKSPPNILTDSSKVACDLTQIAECYGYATITYQPDPQSIKVHYRDGNLLGLSSLVAVSDNGSVVALLSNGTSNEGVKGSNKVKMMIYQHMLDQ